MIQQANTQAHLFLLDIGLGVSHHRAQVCAQRLDLHHTNILSRQLQLTESPAGAVTCAYRIACGPAEYQLVASSSATVVTLSDPQLTARLVHLRAMNPSAAQEQTGPGMLKSQRWAQSTPLKLWPLLYPQARPYSSAPALDRIVRDPLVSSSASILA